MGALAIVFLVAYFIWKCIHDSKEGWRAGGYAMKAREKGARWYYTADGTYRVSDNRKVVVTYDPKTHDLMEWDAKSHTTTNLSADIYDSLLERARYNGKPSAIRRNSWTWHLQDKNPEIPYNYNLRVNTYIDLETKRTCFVQGYEGHTYFRDLATLKLLRPTDDQLLVEKKAKEEGRRYFEDWYFDWAIKHFNLKQEECDKLSSTSYRKVFCERRACTEWSWYEEEFHKPALVGLLGTDYGKADKYYQSIDERVAQRVSMREADIERIIEEQKRQNSKRLC